MQKRQNIQKMLLVAGLVMTSAVGFLAPSKQAHSAADGCDAAKTSVIFGENDKTITVDGAQRQYLLYIPKSYDPTKPTPVVFSFHGFSSNKNQHQQWSAFDAIADENGFLVVYPQGLSFPARWNAGNFGEGEDNPTDVNFVKAMIKTLAETLCIDQSRIYATGFSNGGGMSNRLACQLSDQIAAIGTMAGAYSAIPGGCQPSRPVPVIAFHGKADSIVPYEGRPEVNGVSLPGIEQWAAAWAERNGCTIAPVSEMVKGKTSRIQYGSCKADAEVVLYVAEDGGHTWAGGGEQYPEFIVGKINRDVNASALMWEFFSKHALPK
jgi:polyhydroxybutyrate depolymerase